MLLNSGQNQSLPPLGLELPEGWSQKNYHPATGLVNFPHQEFLIKMAINDHCIVVSALEVGEQLKAMAVAVGN